MRGRLRRRREETGVPFQNLARSMSSAQGKYTLYAVFICAILGMVLSKLLVFIVQKLSPGLSPQDAANLATLIAFAFCAALLIVLLLKMQTIIAAIENRRLKAFNQRLEKRKESDNSNG